MFPLVLELANLDGTNGFAINGVQIGDQLGTAVGGAGDVNGDGLQDFIVGASTADPNGLSSGQAYVLFGRQGGFPNNFNISALNGSNGFRINGLAELDLTGYSVSGAGDVNGDGLGDIIIGAYGADTTAASAGRSYVIFGQREGFSGDLELSTLNGTNGFVLNGIDADDFSGFSVSGAGDVNGDGLDDLFIGAYGANPNSSLVGQGYVVFGQQAGFGANLTFSALTGSNGFRITGISPEDQAGYAVSQIGDVNNDGIDDLLIGAPSADPNGFSSGQAYVVFGRSGGFPANLGLSALNGSTGFRINGLSEEGRLGSAVSGAGDFNGDGINDFMVGAPNADRNTTASGRVYVVFGRSGGFPATFNLSELNGTNGFVLNGAAGEDQVGAAISSAGDINDDGFDDLLIGAPGADPNGLSSGRSYVVFGRTGSYSAQLDLSDLDSADGFQINGISAGDESGRSLSRIGDVNGDGVDDLIISAPNADPDGNSSAGESYVIYGQPGPIAGLVFELPTVNATDLDRGINVNLETGKLQILVGSRLIDRAFANYTGIRGSNFQDQLLGSGVRNFITGNGGGDRIRGFGNNDRLIGGAGADTLFGGAGDDQIGGNTGNDQLIGENGNDSLVGGSNNDNLVGGAGSDKLWGDIGADRLQGDGGSDRFRFGMREAFSRTRMGIDRVVDFRVGIDKIVLDRTTFTNFRSNTPSFTRVRNLEEAARSRALITYVRSEGALFYNANGRQNGFGSGGQFALLQNQAALTAADFVIQA
ncbi:FG-GAP repeat protein [Leptolyngbya sp. FACHB-16]|uniref:FG-GAP repeat protein n=1 Tax=unclassified Leptolyngbya TaxID=2650499 RepID=UPI00168757FD|nr:FG-GAP repeat protein [Leptolyngbya sp. FACHB-16]MBD2155301.1 FG-GAP repeat protein [Leptolyngbya sp. FACHB-16]